MAKNENRLRTRFGSVVTAGLVASALVAAPVTMLVGAVPAMADPQSQGIATINYGNGQTETISTLSDLLTKLEYLSPEKGNTNDPVKIEIKSKIQLTNNNMTIGFLGNSSSRKVDLYLQGNNILNEQEPTHSGEYYDYSNTNAIVANCNLTISDYEDSPDQHPWVGNIEGIGQVRSKNGHAVTADYTGSQVTIEGGFYNSENWEPLFGNITIDKGAFLSDPRESIPGSVNGRTVVTSSTVNGPNAKSYWLVGDYADNAWGSNEGRLLSEASNNVVTIKQMQDPHNAYINQLNVKELINNTNYRLMITGGQATCDGKSVAPNTVLGIDGHLSKVNAFNGATVELENQVYNGKPQRPHGVITIGNETLTQDKDYYLAYSDNTEVGTAHADAVGVGEYDGGWCTGTFEITAAPTPTPEPQPAPTPTPTPAPTPASEAEELRAATTNLGAFIAGMDQRRYTNESVQALQTAVDEANRVLADFASGKATAEQLQGALDKLNAAYGALETKAGITMYRLYNPYSGEHLYTASAAERHNLTRVGWNDEGTGWTAPASSNTAVYRLYNPYTGDHHYTTSASERDQLASIGWNDEGIGWFSDDAQGVPLYRQFNPYAQVGTHNYTTSQAENDHLASIGWHAEGIAWYGMKTTA